MSIRYFYNFCLKGDGDLDGDILSGVRKSYFAGLMRIRDRITAGSDCESLSYEYSIEKGKPMRWSVKDPDGKVLQESVGADDGRYHICFYKDSRITKRLLFSKLHTLLRCEYFDPAGGEVTATLEPRKAKSGLCILYTSSKGADAEALYPMPEINDPKLREKTENYIGYTVMASTDEGSVKFMSMSQIGEFRSFAEYAQSKLLEVREESFVDGETPLYDRINVKDFNIKRNLSTALDITMAAEFSAPAEHTVEPAEAVEAPEADEIVETAETAPEEAAVVEAESAESGESLTDEDIADMDEIPILTQDEASQPAAGPVPDKLIPADGEVYSYYGELDASGNRSGRGRTVTAGGLTAYEGEYRNDKRNGKGSYYYKDGSLCYTGDWADNIRHGVGVGVSSSDGSIHAGRWSLNRPEGNGVRLTQNGDIRFVCKELGDGSTVLLNFIENDNVIVSKYDPAGKKLGEKDLSLKDIIDRID